MIVVTSVPHSGTHFVAHHLLEELPNKRSLGYFSPPAPTTGKYVCHTYDESMQDLTNALDNGNPCIVPIRHPLKVAVSWKRRGKDPNDAIPFWQRLIDQIDPYCPFYLPMDSDEREDWLDNIHKAPYWGSLVAETDWPDKSDGHKGLVQALTYTEMLAVVDLIYAEAPFFTRFDYLF